MNRATKNQTPSAKNMAAKNEPKVPEKKAFNAEEYVTLTIPLE